MILTRCSQDSECFIQHFCIAFAIEDRLSLHELPKEATKCPHINTKRIFFAAVNLEFKSNYSLKFPRKYKYDTVILIQ